MSATAPPVLEMRSETTTPGALLRDVWAHRDLLPLLARQHFRGQYRAARLGIAWAAAQPLVRALVLSVIFTRVARFDTPVPYPAFVFAGTLAFQYLATGIGQGTSVIASSSDLAGKIYFPRLLLAAMPASSSLIGFLIGLAINLGLIFAFGVMPAVHLLTLPLSIGLMFLLVVTATALLSMWHVYWRDLGPLVQAVIQIGFYVTPVIYPTAEIGEYRWLLWLNPATGAVGAVRWSLFGGQEPELLWPLLITIAWTLVMGIAAVRIYARRERICVDRL